MRNIFALIAGSLFGLGLTVSQMVDPDKVIGFLDIFGAWDPSLAFVMGGGLLISVPAFFIAKRRGQTLMGFDFDLPARTELYDPKLIGGASLFGIGWGLVGYCPGPVIAGLTFGHSATWIFLIAMIAGMLAARTALSRQ